MNRHTYPEAAERLRVSERWLRRNISRLPHSKKGRAVTFSDADLDAIDAMHRVEPSSTSPAVPATADFAALRPLPLRSSPRRSA
ncbi:hypothetical protein GCM10014715_39030 [Streptomyces spiralis]|uniref:Uncharacterized protein n=1 Tax=Streptomyces spiralis TaxID=66376 RepID=A0A919DUB1_9ACTN|nr:hypothetical protein GCM10014715_39030 [Streptomyces spiralis]